MELGTIYCHHPPFTLRIDSRRFSALMKIYAYHEIAVVHLNVPFLVNIQLTNLLKLRVKLAVACAVLY